MRTDPMHMRAHRNRGVVGDIAVSKWAGGQERAEEERGPKNKETANNWTTTILANVKLLVVHLNKNTDKEARRAAGTEGNHCRKSGR